VVTYGDTPVSDTGGVVNYSDTSVSDTGVAAVACHLRALAANCGYRTADVALDRVEGVSARSLARQLAALFDQVAA